MSGGLVSVHIDESFVKELCLEKIEAKIKEIDSEFVFWDSAELQRRTCMSWNFIQDTFFFDPGFPKRKVKTKWLFPARETRTFLENWLSEQAKN